MNQWYKQTLFVLRDSTGRIVGISETIPSNDKVTTKEAVERAYSASDDAAMKVLERTRNRRANKRWMGGD